MLFYLMLSLCYNVFKIPALYVTYPKISFQVLQSFKIMDYSLLAGVYNLDQATKERVSVHIFKFKPLL